MSHPAFDALWDGPQKPTGHADALDHLWESPKAKSPASARLPAILKAGDEAVANAEADEQPGYLERVGTHVLNAAQGIPGVERVEAAAGSLGSKLTKNPMSYEQSRDALRSATGKIGGKTSFVEHALGGTAVLPFLPVNAALGGAAIGAADQALSADTESLGERAGKTALGGAVGAAAGHVVGKVAQGATNGLRTLLAKNPADNLIARQAQRALSAKDLYGKAIAQGKANEVTPAIQAFVQEPEIAARVAALQELAPLRGAAPESPEMLDALYKSLSDEAKSIRKGLNVADPSKPNTGRYREQNVKSLQQKLLSATEAVGEKTRTVDVPAMETAQSPHPDLRTALQNFQDRATAAFTRKRGTVEQQMARQALERHGAENVVSPSLRGSPEASSFTETETIPPMMSRYRDAVTDFAKQSGEIDAFGKGYTAQHGGGTPRAFGGLLKKTPQGLAEWARTASPEEQAAASEGVLGRAKLGGQSGGSRLKRAFGTAPEVKNLRALNDNHIADILQKLGITTANAAVTP